MNKTTKKRVSKKNSQTQKTSEKKIEESHINQKPKDIKKTTIRPAKPASKSNNVRKDSISERGRHDNSGSVKNVASNTSVSSINSTNSGAITKLDRANSFYLTRKVSSFFNAITGSRENLSKINKSPSEDEKLPPFKFTRSRSMMTIPLKKNNRRSLIEPQLEQLSEEAERTGRSPGEKEVIESKILNTEQAAFVAKDPPKRKTSGILTTVKRALSGNGEKRKPMNPRWSASLVSLQEIDNMVSYEDLSFINYDKFNTYERLLVDRVSEQDLTKPKTGPTAASCLSKPSLTVIRRRKPRQVTLNDRPKSYMFDPNLDQNFDKKKNLYRQSLDDQKLQHLNKIQRDSFRWSKNLEFPLVESLFLENCNKNQLRSNIITPPRRKSLENSYPRQKSVLDPSNDVDRLKIKLKSKSLTHLDSMDSVVSYRQENLPVTSPQKPKISSSEYFSVHFYTDVGCFEEELIPAAKGLTLAEAMSCSLKRRNLTFSEITICDNYAQTFFELGSSPNSLDENTEVENLVGKVLVVSEKENKKTATLQKAASFGSRTRPPRLLSSASTEETTELDLKIIPGKQLKQRWSGLFGIKNPHQSQLCELLNNYNKNGVPQKLPLHNFDYPRLNSALEYLDNIHKSWRDFVESPTIPENEVKIQSAIWELVTTEVDYIHALQTVTDLFLACLEAIQEEKLLIDVDQNKLFSNIRDICEANIKFWTLYLYPMVAESISTRNPMRIDVFQEGFISFATTFAPYKKYCAEQSTCQFYCKELNRNNALFTAYLAWCESQKMCNRLRLADILVRPMQRLTKYGLLLSAIRKHISDENDSDVLDSMIHSVENFVCSVNSHLTTRQENERLKGIMARIESYDVVDSNNEHLDKLTKQYCNMFDLCSPMKGCSSSHSRHLFMEGDLKFRDSIGKVDVHCFLLTDILLICKTIAKKGHGTLKVIRQPYITDRLVIKHRENILYCIYLNEFQMAVTAFTLQCSEAKSWNDAITKAKHIYSRIKQGSSSDGQNLRYSTNNNAGLANNSDTLGIKKSPLNSSIGSRISSLNNSHSGSVELDSRNISTDFEKTNSLSSDEGSYISSAPTKPKTLTTSPYKLKNSSSNQLAVQPVNHLGQSLPNLNLSPHSISNNTLLVPGTSSSHSGNLLLSPSHRGISYPPPSPTRATLRRGFAFSSIKNPPLVKSRNITSQSSFNWQQGQNPTTPSTSPQSQDPSQNSQQPTAVQLNSGLQLSNESDV